jgi:predicted DNA-binding protein (UPF0278 family)
MDLPRPPRQGKAVAEITDAPTEAELDELEQRAELMIAEADDTITYYIKPGVRRELRLIAAYRESQAEVQRLREENQELELILEDNDKYIKTLRTKFFNELRADLGLEPSKLPEQALENPKVFGG